MDQPSVVAAEADLPAVLRAGPFTTAMALESGLDRYCLAGLVAAGRLRHPMRGVYHSVDLPDNVALRIACLKLVLPPGYVLTDRTAGWLWGVPSILAPGDHLQVPAVSAFGPSGTRLRNSLTLSGERTFSARDLREIDGIQVTTPLRTACDLGRLLHRDQAIGALDALLRHGSFTSDELLLEVGRFRRFRGVVQLRFLAPLADARAQSPQESVLRLRWIDCGLPRPECQVEVDAPSGGSYFIDVGLPDLRFGAEYDGADFHGPGDRDHDDARRAWIADSGEWLLVVARAEHVHGRDPDIYERLLAGFAQQKAYRMAPRT